MIKDKDDAVQFEFSGNTVNEKIDSIIQAIANGQITSKQGETLMGILRSGFEIVELGNLMSKLQEAGLIEKSVV